MQTVFNGRVTETTQRRSNNNVSYEFRWIRRHVVISIYYSVMQVITSRCSVVRVRVTIVIVVVVLTPVG